MADKAYITPRVLRWARESARMAEETSAAKVSVPVERLKAWEEPRLYSVAIFLPPRHQDTKKLSAFVS